jgi:hypothetical protein
MTDGPAPRNYASGMPSKPAPPSFAAPTLDHFATLLVEVGTPQDIGITPRGRRRLVPITGGSAEGHGWQARVVPGGADFQLMTASGMSDLDARYTLETDAGDWIYVQNTALRCGAPEAMARLARGEPVDPAEIYFRCAPRFETASLALGWMNERLFIGSGVRRPDCVEMAFFTLT